MKKYKLIYNPNAGKKRKVVSHVKPIMLEDIFALLTQYQIEFDPFPTKCPGDATLLAKDAQKEGYEYVLAAGGDGTVGEVANGLINSDIKLGILPLGSFMNVARMLSIPTEMEKAVELIKIERLRKIDVGCLIRLDGEKLSDPYYFIEGSSIGMEAQFHELALLLERGQLGAIKNLIKTLTDYYWQKFTIKLDEEEFKVRASMITVSNGPYTGAALKTAPDAKLNDHQLTVMIYKMTNWELIKYFIKLLGFKQAHAPNSKTYQVQYVKISAKDPRQVHADARVFGTTPVEYKIVPNALNVICGFPKTSEDTALERRTYLDP
jgi:YegS/Rv2252/BmrU family lipid kinase